jgi:SAGA-associated factor 73
MDVARAFVTGHPMQDDADIVRCNHCKRPVLRHKAKAHIEECIQKKQEKQRKKKEAKDARDAAARRAERENADSESEEEDTTMGSKTAGKNDGTSGKKRKAEDSTEGAKKKKKKDEPKAKAPRPKAPVDVEKQCGVPLANGAQCARSLTCKSHSMGAKRAVPGRSAPYDKLLAEYQRKNQAKLQSTYSLITSQQRVADIHSRTSSRSPTAIPGRRVRPHRSHRLRRREGPCSSCHRSFPATPTLAISAHTPQT